MRMVPTDQMAADSNELCSCPYLGSQKCLGSNESIDSIILHQEMAPHT